MLNYLNELIYDNCDIYNTVSNITTTCGTNMMYAEEKCYPECIAALLTAAHTCKYFFIRSHLYDNLMDILKQCKIMPH